MTKSPDPEGRGGATADPIIDMGSLPVASNLRCIRRVMFHHLNRTAPVFDNFIGYFNKRLFWFGYSFVGGVR